MIFFGTAYICYTLIDKEIKKTKEYFKGDTDCQFLCFNFPSRIVKEQN